MAQWATAERELHAHPNDHDEHYNLATLPDYAEEAQRLTEVLRAGFRQLR